MELFRYKRSFKKALIWAAVAIVTIYRNRSSIAYPIFMISTLAILAWDAKTMGKSLIKNIEGKLDIKDVDYLVIGQSASHPVHLCNKPFSSQERFI